ncbi:MAG: hypothetical protein WHU94_00180 [Thermogemmata sp.]|jgi:hypothetical protein|uniref:Uncharacterized protein n=1 Tax=Thermogemmata fonticola TaxID=2755323 RepID=A0A7V9ABY5_9BACT|nr:hypothetical protein [Thermogemmata fonticola]MBA2226563.1 hypothetical protein [Thermogemmata fonticola]MCX8140859.1 hypothetical protein [Gemmataceae bacterium]GIW85078.1 MAG: hypothetical protein KatS3mg107_0738 [Gemmataceae bacterium]
MGERYTHPRIIQKMLQQRLREAVERTQQLMELWKGGQVAPELVQTVVEAGLELREVLVHEGGHLPEDIREEAIKFLGCIEEVIRCGEEWLKNSGGPQLAETAWRERLGKAYGLTSTLPNMPR